MYSNLQFFTKYIQNVKSIWFWYRNKKKPTEKQIPFSETCAAICASVTASWKKIVIAHNFNIDRKTIDCTITWFLEHHKFKFRLRTGGLTLLNSRRKLKNSTADMKILMAWIKKAWEMYRSSNIYRGWQHISLHGWMLHNKTWYHKCFLQ